MGPSLISLFWSQKRCCDVVISEIAQSLKMLSHDMGAKLAGLSPQCRKVMFATCVIHGFLVARQAIGARALTQR